MDSGTWTLIAVSIVGVVLSSALYAVVYGLIARFGMAMRLSWIRSFGASLLGLILGLAFVSVIGASAYESGFGGPGYLLIVLGGWALVMTAINVLLVRAKDGAKINFIQGFVLQLVPNALLISYSIATRPNF